MNYWVPGEKKRKLKWVNRKKNHAREKERKRKRKRVTNTYNF